MKEQLNFAKMNGLIPVTVQDADTGVVLIVGFMNEEAHRRTVNERQVVFWSRTKERLWKKGETSGNYLDVVSIQPDCDNDALLILVHPRGPVCHTGQRSCFGDDRHPGLGFVLQELRSIIEARSEQKPEGSYTSELLDEGLARISQKVGEEAIELAIAAQYPDNQRSVEEAADLFYHILVLFRAKDIDLDDVGKELTKRMAH